MSFTVSAQGRNVSVPVETRSAPPVAPKAEPVVAAPVVVEAAPVVERPNPQLAELAQKAKIEREAQRKWETEKAAWEAEKSKYIALDDLKKDPLKFMEQSGVTYDQLTQAAIATVDPVQSELKALRAKLAEYDNKFTAIDEGAVKASEAQRVSAAKQIAYEAGKLSDSPELEVYKAFGQEGHDLVSKKIFDYYDETGNLLDVVEAVKAVNAELTEELKTRFGSLSLFKQLTETKVETPKTPTTQAQVTTQARTLTNSMTPAAGRKLTSGERRERAIRAMRGEKLD